MIQCKFVHNTGTIIRFRPSQLGQLPSDSQNVRVVLPTGRVAQAFFNRHPANPYIGGPELVRYIKSRVSSGKTEEILLEQRSLGLWVVHLFDETDGLLKEVSRPTAAAHRGSLAPADLGALLSLADKEADRGKRMEVYRRILRPSGLSRLVVSLVGANCQAEGCEACEQFNTQWGTGSGGTIVEVHHIEHLARTTDHHPRNLCVLCANHHRFVHRYGPWRIRHVGSDVSMTCGGAELVIRRPKTLFPAV